VVPLDGYIALTPASFRILAGTAIARTAKLTNPSNG
jgi:hypothetical protein